MVDWVADTTVLFKPSVVPTELSTYPPICETLVSSVTTGGSSYGLGAGKHKK